MTSWIVQTNLVKEELFPSIKEVAESEGHGCIGLKIIPFSDSIEFMADIGFRPPEGKLIPYGSTSMIKMFARSNWNKQGFFFNYENLRTSKWIKELGTRVLNHDAYVVPLKEAMGITGDMKFFMKPDNDLKDFSGSIVTASEIGKFYDQVSAGGFCFDTDIPVVLSPVKLTGWEYRIFMIKDVAIAYSSYKLRDMLRQDKYVPDHVLCFAEETARIWRPDDVYVMDICETEDDLKVIEFNCFNASGFYNANVGQIVRKVSCFVESL